MCDCPSHANLQRGVDTLVKFTIIPRILYKHYAFFDNVLDFTQHGKGLSHTQLLIKLLDLLMFYYLGESSRCVRKRKAWARAHFLGAYKTVHVLSWDPNLL